MSIKIEVGKRYLIKYLADIKGAGSLFGKIEPVYAAVEVKILELSPSGKWCKVHYDHNNHDTWKITEDVSVVEELG